MLSAAVSLFFALAVGLAVAVIAASLRDARDAWERLSREGEVLRAALALRSSARDMSLRPAPRRVFATRRPGSPAAMPLRACAA